MRHGGDILGAKRHSTFGESGHTHMNTHIFKQILK